MIALRWPDGFRPYGGATISAIFDDNGGLYWACCGALDGRFGMYVFHQTPNGVNVVSYGPLHSGRGTLQLQNGRVYLTTWDNGERASVFQIATVGDGTSTQGSCCQNGCKYEVLEDRLKSLEASNAQLLQTIDNRVYSRFKDFLWALGDDFFYDRLDRLINHHRPDYDRRLRDWVKGKVDAWRRTG